MEDIAYELLEGGGAIVRRRRRRAKQVPRGSASHCPTFILFHHRVLASEPGAVDKGRVAKSPLSRTELKDHVVDFFSFSFPSESYSAERGWNGLRSVLTRSLPTLAPSPPGSRPKVIQHSPQRKTINRNGGRDHLADGKVHVTDRRLFQNRKQ